MPEFCEGAPSLEIARVTYKKRAGGTPSVSNVLSGSGADGVTLWEVDMRFSGIDL